MAFPSPDRLPQYKDNLPSKNEHIEKLPEGETKRLLQLLREQTSAKAAIDKTEHTDSTMEQDFSSFYKKFFQSDTYKTFTPSSTQNILQYFVKWTGDNKISLSQSLSSTNKELTLATFRNMIYALINQIKTEEAKRLEELGIPRETTALKNEILEQSKRKFEKLLEVNGQPFEIKHIHLVKSTSAGNEYIVVGKMKGSGGEFDEKITSLPTAFHIKESHKTDGTVVVVSMERMPNFGHSQWTRSIEKNHLLLNGLMAFEIKGIPSKEVKKANTSITYDKAKTKEKIQEHLRQKSFSCTPEGLNVDNLPPPMQHLKTKLSTILQDSFLLDKQVETQGDQWDTHTRDLIIKDDQWGMKKLWPIPWKFDSDNIALLPDPSEKEFPISLLGKEFTAKLTHDPQGNIHLQFDENVLKEMTAWITEGFLLTMKTLNGAYTGTPEKYPTLTKRNRQEIQTGAPKEFYYNVTKTNISLVQGFITNLNEETWKDALLMTMYPQRSEEKPKRLTTLDEYGKVVPSTVVSNGKKLKTKISISSKDEQPYLEIDTKKSREKIKDYQYLTFSWSVATTLALNDRTKVKVAAMPEGSNPTQVDFMDVGTKQMIGNLKVTYDQDTGYKVETAKNNVEIKASHFYDKLPDASAMGYTALGISQNDLRIKFDQLFKEKFKDDKKSLEGAILNEKYYKLSVDDQSVITLIDSAPSEVDEIIQKMTTFLQGMKQVYELPIKYDDGIDKVELNKMAAWMLGSDTFSVGGRNELDLTKSSFTLTKNILDGDNKKQSVVFTLKWTTLSLGAPGTKDQTLTLGKGIYDVRYTSKELRVIPKKEP